MFYAKLKNEECEVKVGLTNDNIFVTFPMCGKEQQIDISEIFPLIDFDMEQNSVYCETCSQKINRLRAMPDAPKD